MNADLAGALEQLNNSWRTFIHNDKPMTKEQVRKALVYGLKKGYKGTNELTDQDIETALADNDTKSVSKPPPEDELNRGYMLASLRLLEDMERKRRVHVIAFTRQVWEHESIEKAGYKFSKEELDYADDSELKFIGTRNGIDCYLPRMF